MGPRQGQQIGKPHPSLASPSPFAPLGADPKIWCWFGSRRSQPTRSPLRAGDVLRSLGAPCCELGSARQGFGAGSASAARRGIKKKAGNQAAERDPAAFPGSHAFPGLRERHSPAPTRPRPPNQLLKFPISAFFFFFSACRRRDSFPFPWKKGGREAARCGGRVPERSPRVSQRCQGPGKARAGICPQKGAVHPSSTLLKLSRAPEEGAEVAAVGAEHAGGREELKMNF